MSVPGNHIIWLGGKSYQATHTIGPTSVGYGHRCTGMQCGIWVGGKMSAECDTTQSFTTWLFMFYHPEPSVRIKPSAYGRYYSQTTLFARSKIYQNGLKVPGIFVRHRIFVIIIIQFGGNLFRYYLVFVRQIIIVFVIVIVNEGQ